MGKLLPAGSQIQMIVQECFSGSRGSHDDKGNVISYEYSKKIKKNIARSLPQESIASPTRPVMRTAISKRIRYGKKTPGPQPDYLFQIVFDYGEHDANQPGVEEIQTWALRPDPFSSFRAGFEIRTYRLCRRVLVFHEFLELGTGPCLVRSTDFGFDLNPVASFLTATTQTGYVRDKQSGIIKRHLSRSWNLAIGHLLVDQQIRFIGPRVSITCGWLNGSGYRWLDLDSEGLSGMLSEEEAPGSTSEIWETHNRPRRMSRRRTFSDDLRMATSRSWTWLVKVNKCL